MVITKLITVIAAAATLITVGISAADASVTQTGPKAVSGIQWSSIACTAKTCVAVGADSSGTGGKAALINPATESVKLGSGVLKNMAFATDPDLVACPTANTCLSLPVLEGVATVSAKTGALRETAKVKPVYSLAEIGCAGSKVCYALGSYSPPSVLEPSQGYLAKISPAGKILSTSVNKNYVGYSGISCESSSFCLTSEWSVKGPWQVTPLVNGKFGKARNLPSGFQSQTVSCYSDKLCYTLGSAGSGNPGPQELVPLNPKTGAAGRPVKLRLVGPSGESSAGIACYSGTQCVVAGFIVAGKGNAARSEAAYVVITKGKVGPLVVASTKTGSSFTDVACASAKECYAVGTYPILTGSGGEVSIIDKV